MTTPGQPPVPPPPPPPPPVLQPAQQLPVPQPPAPQPRGRRFGSRARLAVLGLALLLLLGSGAALIALIARPAEPDFPDSWDPRVADLAAFVERERDLQFQHPVDVDFRAEEDFVAYFRSQNSQGGDDDANDDGRFTQFARALRLAEGDIDIAEQSEKLAEVSVLAFYSYDEHRITVRGTTLDVATKVTVVHELTHALQDQRFDLGELNEQARRDDIADPTPLIEGDAVRIENRYIEALGPRQREEYDHHIESQSDRDDFDDFPLYLRISLSFPYQVGPMFVGVLDADGGNDAIDQAFTSLPETEEMYIDPVAYERSEPAEHVDAFDDVDPDRIVDAGGSFGAVGWYLVLAEHIDAAVALDAALGWGGDRYRQIEAHDETCVQLRFAGDTAADTDAMEAALEQWRDAVSDRQFIEIERRFGFVELEACDPGPDARGLTTDRMGDAFTLLLIRLDIISSTVEEYSYTASTCIADAAVQQFSFEELQRETQSAAMQRTITEILTECAQL
jgi:hypothetical protein